MSAVDAAERLEQASRAWTELRTAQTTLSRLRRYRQLNATMRADLQAAAREVVKAEATLSRVLRPSP